MPDVDKLHLDLQSERLVSMKGTRNPRKCLCGALPSLAI